MDFAVKNFEWDPGKNRENTRKHGISFEEAVLIFEGPVLTQIDMRFDYGEVRELSLGTIEGVVVIVVVHTPRMTKVRLISARVANKKERNLYHEHLSKKT